MNPGNSAPTPNCGRNEYSKNEITTESIIRTVQVRLCNASIGELGEEFEGREPANTMSSGVPINPLTVLLQLNATAKPSCGGGFWGGICEIPMSRFVATL